MTGSENVIQWLYFFGDPKLFLTSYIKEFINAEMESLDYSVNDNTGLENV